MGWNAVATANTKPPTEAEYIEHGWFKVKAGVGIDLWTKSENGKDFEKDSGEVIELNTSFECRILMDLFSLCPTKVTHDLDIGYEIYPFNAVKEAASLTWTVDQFKDTLESWNELYKRKCDLESLKENLDCVIDFIQKAAKNNREVSIYF